MVGTCRLTRNYSIASLVGIGLVALLLVWFYRSEAAATLMEREGQVNSEIARTLANHVWPGYGDFIRGAAGKSPEAIRHSDVFRLLRRDLRSKLQGLRVVKVKIYNRDGLVVYSTQQNEVGDNAFDSPGVQSALQERIFSEIIYRDRFSAFEQQIYDRNLVASYIPVKRAADAPPEGVFEIYSDVTPLLQEIERIGYRIALVVTALLMLLYLFLLLIVRRADVTIRRYTDEQRLQQQQHLDYLERHDELTALYNRNGILHTLRAARRRSLGIDTALGVMTIKLLRFRSINDSLGHRLGDKLLQDAARRIVACAPGGDSVGRIDGDEFVIVLANLLSLSEADFIAAKLQDMFAEPFTLEGHSMTVVPAIGVCIAENDEYSVEQLLMNAGSAIDVAKRSPSRRYVVFDSELESATQERFELEQELSHAVAEKQFVLYFQPRVAADSGRVIGMEALLRWRHPQRGLVMPGQFIALLEESGEIVNLGSWLLLEACNRCKAWLDEGESLRVAVNVSLKQLHADDFLQSVRDALALSGLPAQHLELELTESILAEDKRQTGELLRELKRIGVSISIDDFGTGYSSLSYLMHFPVDCIKIDRSFIRDMIRNHDHAALTNAIIAMGKSLKLNVVAEGVETREQLETVTGMGCDELQGFYFSQAVAADAFIEVMATIHTMR